MNTMVETTFRLGWRILLPWMLLLAFLVVLFKGTVAEMVGIWIRSETFPARLLGASHRSLDRMAQAGAVATRPAEVSSFVVYTDGAGVFPYGFSVSWLRWRQLPIRFRDTNRSKCPGASWLEPGSIARLPAAVPVFHRSVR